MPNTPELSEAKRALLEKLLRGDIPHPIKAASTTTQTTQLVQEISLPLSEAGSLSSRSPLVTIQSEGSKRPFFYLHVHWEGGAFYCFTLASDLGADQPFYVLEPYKFDGLKVPPTIETMAADYIETMRTVQPEGPYLLGGFCGGCLIAIEMARQLWAQGEAVDLLALVEPGLTGRMIPVLERRGPILLKMVGGFIRCVGSLLLLTPDKQLDWFLRLRHMYRVVRHRGRHLPLNPSSEFLRQDWIGIYVWLASAYIPTHYQGKVTYFWASEEPDSRRVAWKSVAKAEKSEIIMIPGTHVSCRNEHVHGLAERLGAYLSKIHLTAMK